jgi:hypothetical protein
MGFTGFAGYPRESSPFIEVLRLREKKVKPGFPSEETWESLQWIQVPSEAVFGGLPYVRLCVHILFNFRHCLGVHVRLLGAARSVSPLILLGQVFCFFFARPP